MSFDDFIGNVIDRTVGARRKGAYSIYRLGKRIVRSYENQNGNMETNGEQWFLNKMVDRGDSIVWDVGANRGEWILTLAQQPKPFSAYCFEPVPSTFGDLIKNISDPRVHLFNVALGSEQGELMMNESLDNNRISSVYDVTKHTSVARVKKIVVPVTIGDVKLKELGLSNITLLKIDVEGHDYNALSGFQNAMKNGNIDFVQFEYNAYTLIGGRSLREFYELLSDKYILTRLLPDGLEALGYHFTLDNFSHSNWVAIRKDIIDEKLVKTLNIRTGRGLFRDSLVVDIKDNPELMSLLGIHR